MKNLIICIVALVIFFNTKQTLLSDDHFSRYGNVKKYVMGGLSKNGDGTSLRPYNSLAAAEADKSWNTLIVLASAVPLDGGITLTEERALIGEKDPTDDPLTINQSMITNSSELSNGGNGIIVVGDHVNIKDIYVKNTFAAGIRYDNVNYLEISNVWISGHNQNSVCKSNAEESNKEIKIAAIHGQHTGRFNEKFLIKI